jgi:hypothetical protein
MEGVGLKEKCLVVLCQFDMGGCYGMSCAHERPRSAHLGEVSCCSSSFRCSCCYHARLNSTLKLVLQW